MNPEIDSTSLSASSIERRNSLERHLQLRPEAQDLRNRHILVEGGVAPTETDTPETLHRRPSDIDMYKDSLQRHLAQRPERGQLVERNILPSTTTAPGLQAQARELERHMRVDSLEQKVRNRPGVEELIERGILGEAEDPREPAY